MEEGLARRREELDVLPLRLARATGRQKTPVVFTAATNNPSNRLSRSTNAAYIVSQSGRGLSRHTAVTLDTSGWIMTRSL